MKRFEPQNLILTANFLKDVSRFVNACTNLEVDPSKALILFSKNLKDGLKAVGFSNNFESDSFNNRFTVKFTEKEWSIQGFGMNLNQNNTPYCEGEFRYHDLYYYDDELGRDMMLVLNGKEKGGKPIMNIIPLKQNLFPL